MDRSGRPKNRTVLEAFAEFHPSKGAFLSSANSPLVICSLSVCTSPDGSESQIYVGTLDGSVLLLSLLSLSVAVPSKQNGAPHDEDAGEMGRSDTSSPANIAVAQSASVGRSPVEVIQVFPEIGRLIVLSEGFLFLMDVLLLQPAQRLAISGATALSRRLVCSDLASSDPLGHVASKSEKFGAGQRFLQKLGGGNRANGVRSKVHVGQRAGEVKCFLAVAAGRKLVLLELSLQEGTNRDTTEYGGVSVLSKEILGVEGVQTIAWLDDSIIVGTTGGYALFSTTTGQSTPLFSLPEFSGPPQLKPLFKSKEALLFVDNVGIVVNSFGQPVGGSLVFQQVPDSITEVPPYIIVSGDGWVDLYRKNTGICVQSASYPKGNGRPCLVASDDLGAGQLVAVATPIKVKHWSLCSVKEPCSMLNHISSTILHLRSKHFHG